MNEQIVITKEEYEAYKKQLLKKFTDELSEEFIKVFPWEYSVLIRAKIREVLARTIGE